MICSSFYLLAIGARCPAITLLGRPSAKPSNKAMCKPPHKSLMESLSIGKRRACPPRCYKSTNRAVDWRMNAHRFVANRSDWIRLSIIRLIKARESLLIIWNWYAFHWEVSNIPSDVRDIVWCVCYTSMPLNAGEHKRSFRIMTQEGRGMIFCSELFSVYGVMNGTHGHLGKSGSLRRSNAMATLGIPLGRRWAGGREIP